MSTDICERADRRNDENEGSDAKTDATTSCTGDSSDSKPSSECPAIAAVPPCRTPGDIAHAGKSSSMNNNATSLLNDSYEKYFPRFEYQQKVVSSLDRWKKLISSSGYLNNRFENQAYRNGGGNLSNRNQRLNERETIAAPLQSLDDAGQEMMHLLFCQDGSNEHIKVEENTTNDIVQNFSLSCCTPIGKYLANPTSILKFSPAQPQRSTSLQTVSSSSTTFSISNIQKQNTQPAQALQDVLELAHGLHLSEKESFVLYNKACELLSGPCSRTGSHENNADESDFYEPNIALDDGLMESLVERGRLEFFEWKHHHTQSNEQRDFVQCSNEHAFCLSDEQKSDEDNEQFFDNTKCQSKELNVAHQVFFHERSAILSALTYLIKNRIEVSEELILRSKSCERKNNPSLSDILSATDQLLDAGLVVNILNSIRELTEVRDSFRQNLFRMTKVAQEKKKCSKQNFAVEYAMLGFTQRCRCTLAQCVYNLAYHTQFTPNEVESLLILVGELTNDLDVGLPVLNQLSGYSPFFSTVTPHKKHSIVLGDDLMSKLWGRRKPPLSAQCETSLILSAVCALETRHLFMDRKCHGPDPLGVGNSIFRPQSDASGYENLRALLSQSHAIERWRRRDILGLFQKIFSENDGVERAASSPTEITQLSNDNSVAHSTSTASKDLPSPAVERLRQRKRDLERSNVAIRLTPRCPITTRRELPSRHDGVWTPGKPKLAKESSGSNLKLVKPNSTEISPLLQRLRQQKRSLEGTRNKALVSPAMPPEPTTNKPETESIQKLKPSVLSPIVSNFSADDYWSVTNSSTATDKVQSPQILHASPIVRDTSLATSSEGRRVLPLPPKCRRCGKCHEGDSLCIPQESPNEHGDCRVVKCLVHEFEDSIDDFGAIESSQPGSKLHAVKFDLQSNSKEDEDSTAPTHLIADENCSHDDASFNHQGDTVSSLGSASLRDTQGNSVIGSAISEQLELLSSQLQEHDIKLNKLVSRNSDSNDDNKASIVKASLSHSSNAESDDASTQVETLQLQLYERNLQVERLIEELALLKTEHSQPPDELFEDDIKQKSKTVFSANFAFGEAKRAVKGSIEEVEELESEFKSAMEHFSDDFDQVLSDIYDEINDEKNDNKENHLSKKQESLTNEDNVDDPKVMIYENPGGTKDLDLRSSSGSWKEFESVLGGNTNLKHISVDTTNCIHNNPIDSPSIESTFDAIRSIEQKLAKQKKEDRKGMSQLETELHSLRKDIAQLAHSIQQTAPQESKTNKKRKNLLKSLVHSFSVRKHNGQSSKQNQ